MVRLNCQSNQGLCRQERVMAFPGVRLYKHGTAIWPEYNGDRTPDALVSWLLDIIAKPLHMEHHSFENFTDHGCRVQGQFLFNVFICSAFLHFTVFWDRKNF